MIKRNPPQRKDAGVFRYSDLNFVVLAMVLDAGTPRGPIRSIQRDLLSPLGLHDTAPSVDPKVERLVDGYDGKGSMFGSDAMQRDGRLIYNPQFEWGGGGFASTPRDLARWMAAFRRGEAFPDSLWPMAVARPPGTPDTASKWRGMGIHVDSGALEKRLAIAATCRGMSAGSDGMKRQESVSRSRPMPAIVTAFTTTGLTGQIRSHRMHRRGAEFSHCSEHLIGTSNPRA